MLSAASGIEIIFTGFTLSQADLDVWSEILRCARCDFKDGRGVMFSSPHIHANKFLRSLGRGTGGSDIKWLMGSFTRLQAAVVEINAGKYGYSGHLIDQIIRRSDIYEISLNSNLVHLFGRDGWTGVEVQYRNALKKYPLAQWLHAFYSSHQNSNSFKYSALTISSLCGSRNQEIRMFRRDLKKALKMVAEVTGWECCINKKDLVHIVKPWREEVLIPQGRYAYA